MTGPAPLAPDRAALETALAEVAAALPPGTSLDLPSLTLDLPPRAGAAEIAAALRAALAREAAR